MTRPFPRPLLVAGPTASGKSAFALAAARRDGGIVINADSMQVYAELRLLTARPGLEDLALAPHRLYGHVPARDAYSVSRWLDDVRDALEEAGALGARPIIVGGTGLYFLALLEGLSPVPPVPLEVRERWRRDAAAAGPGELHARLAERDPVMAGRLAPGDTQRITRALEVIEATGRSLAAWQEVRGSPLMRAADAERVLVWPDREVLRHRCHARFDQMMAAGAMTEIAGLAQLGLPRELPVFAALGVRPLLAALTLDLPVEEAVERAKVQTVQYVKRQETWLRKHMRDWSRLS
ncbi:MAG: tRNA (adenosine(37)-N6)-dimethylallyltransferase MiaA [Hyphomicrobiaceae bacterium]